MDRAGGLAAGILMGALGLCLGLPEQAGAAEVRVRMSANTTQVSITRNFQVTVTIDGAQGELDPPKLEGDGFQVLNQSGQQSIQIVGFGGRKASLTYTYLLRPTKAGTVEILPVTVSVAGKTIQASAGLKIEVIPIQPQDDLVVEMTGPPGPIYIDQEFTVTLKIWARRMGGANRPHDPFIARQRTTWPLLSIPWIEQEGFSSEETRAYLNPFLSKSQEGFLINGFTLSQGIFNKEYACFSLPRTEEKRKAADGRQYDCFVYSLEKRFRPQKTGKFLFGGVTAQGSMAADRQGEVRRIEIVAQSDPLEITVNAPPEDGRPPFFTGAIGAWKVSADVKPRKVWVGAPLTLTVTVTGNGLLENVGPPPLAPQEGFADLFRIHEEAATGVSDPKTRSKTFTYGIRAKTSAVKAIPPIAFAYFDLQNEKYVTLKTTPIPIEVVEGKSTGTEVFDIRRGLDMKSEVKILDQTLYTLHEEPDALESAAPVERFGTLHGILFAAPPVVALAILGIAARRRKLRADPAILRARGAYRSAQAILREASAALSKEAGAPDVQGAIARALATLIGDRLSIPSAGMTAANAASALHDAGVDEGLAAEAVLAFEQTDNARYGAGGGDRQAPQKQLEAAGNLLRRLQAALGARKGRK